ncbi:putative uncharacterized protein [Caballeronia insecticola]|uniref:Uncharacterized protein n=1 Tax=Caballeronia insecticola TaxID=758793 RepID=R4WGE3_9BURK|nr:putative uncharacterized protein [Caballeronia insecticola]
MLATAPSFVLRKKSVHAIPDAIPSVVPDVHPQDVTPEEKIDAPSQATPIRPLRPLTGLSMQAGPKSLENAQIAEVEGLVEQSALVTFRTFHSFSYATSLLFHPRELAYYVVLYHESEVWRVLKASEIDTAEPAFRHFVEQAMRLAEAEMRRAFVEAQHEQIARQIAESEAEIERARVDRQRGTAQNQQVALKQQEVGKALAQLEGRSIASQVQLNKLQRRLHQLNADFKLNAPNGPQKR